MDQTLKGQDRAIEKLPVIFLLVWGILFGFVWLGMEGEVVVVLRGLFWGIFGLFFYGFFQFGFYDGVIFVTANHFTFPVNHKTEKHFLQ